MYIYMVKLYILYISPLRWPTSVVATWRLVRRLTLVMAQVVPWTMDCIAPPTAFVPAIPPPTYGGRNRCQRGLIVYTHRIHGAGIYTNIGGILMVNVTIYGIHGSYGIYILNEVFQMNHHVYPLVMTNIAIENDHRNSGISQL